MPERNEAPSSPLPGSVAVVVHEGETLLALAGVVDLAVVRSFEENHPALPRIDAIDAGDVTILTATGVGLMLRARRSAAEAGRTVVLRRSNPHVDRVLRLLELEPVFPRPQ